MTFMHVVVWQGPFTFYKTLNKGHCSNLVKWWDSSFADMANFTSLKQEHTGPTVGCLKRLGRLRWGQEQICLVCSAALEAFGTVWTTPAPIQHAKSERVGCRLPEPSLYADWLCARCMTFLIGGVVANQCGVWEGWNTVCTLVFYALRSVVSCFHVLEYWHETSATCSLHLAQAQNVHATVEMATRRSGATSLPNRSDERQWSGRIKAVGCWFESGRCVGGGLNIHIW